MCVVLGCNMCACVFVCVLRFVSLFSQKQKFLLDENDTDRSAISQFQTTNFDCLFGINRCQNDGTSYDLYESNLEQEEASHCENGKRELRKTEAQATNGV